MNVGVSRATVMWPSTALRNFHWVSQQRCSEEDAHVDRDGHAGLRAGCTGVGDGLFDHPEVGAVGAAEVRVPLVLLEVREDRVLGVCHLRGLHKSSRAKTSFL